ncbi:MAG: AAA family ATPase [Bdellovibrionota bacterium]|jgi:MoxR-like ATPase
MSSDLELQKKCVSHFNDVREALHKNIVGMDATIDALFWTLLCGGHSLFVGVPGLAKTLLISSLSDLIGLNFNRVQFTPDMMPGDLIGGEILEEDRKTGKRVFDFRKGPIFCQMLLADEINRTSPKTQSALLQAMQEKRISFAGQTFNLEPPFVVFATQNPIESEGTYPLPEAQLDRFLFSIPITYPSIEDEKEIVRRTTSTQSTSLEPMMSAQDLLSYQELVRRLPIDESLIERCVAMVRRTRPSNQMKDSLKEAIRFGAGPRASQALALGAKARALLSGRFAVREEDLEVVAPFVLEHRLVLRKMRSQSSREILDQVLSGA